jgi:hypothetical protein
MVIFYVYAQAGKEITILRSIYADRKPSYRKPLHVKEKTSQTVLRVSLYWNVAKILATDGVQQNINVSRVIT